MKPGKGAESEFHSCHILLLKTRCPAFGQNLSDMQRNREVWDIHRDTQTLAFLDRDFKSAIVNMFNN